MVETLLDKPSQWLSGDGPDADLAVMCQCRLVRNLADYPFPAQCTDDEKHAIEERLVSVLDSLNLLATGTYWSLDSLDAREKRFLVERRLITSELLNGTGARGVYIADDQSLSISVNDENHVTVLALASGIQLQEVWVRVNLIDDTLAGVLDFAFNERLGYLTTSIADLGTGLKASILLHLPGLVMAGGMTRIEELIHEKRHALEELYPPKSEAPGDLFQLVNLCTLGRSEEETVFHVKHMATELITQEKEARTQILSQAPFQLEDRVGRALGLARGARLLAFTEALTVLSSLRLGVSNGLLDRFSLCCLNDVFMSSQNAHIEMRSGRDCDELTLSAERADLFRARFA